MSRNPIFTASYVFYFDVSSWDVLDCWIIYECGTPWNNVCV